MCALFPSSFLLQGRGIEGLWKEIWSFSAIDLLHVASLLNEHPEEELSSSLPSDIALSNSLLLPRQYLKQVPESSWLPLGI